MNRLGLAAATIEYDASRHPVASPYRVSSRPWGLDMDRSYECQCGPLRLGGANEIGNLAPSCDSCNKRRGAYLLNAIVGRSSPAKLLWPTDQEETP